jgi:oligoribonuclease
MFLFLDIETTGLDPHWDSILEIGIQGFSNDLKFVPHHYYSSFVKPRTTWLSRINSVPVVKEMHADSGLTKSITLLERTLPSVAEVETKALKFLDDMDLKPGTMPMCGSSVQFDRLFLAVYMPRLEAWFHYRNIDVSTIRELAKQWYPDLDEPDVKPMAKHRVMSDIMDSVHLLQHYRNTIFKATPSAVVCEHLSPHPVGGGAPFGTITDTSEVPFIEPWE